MRIAVTLILGAVLDVIAAPFTVPLWQTTIHEPIVATPRYGMQSANLALLLLDVAGAVFIIGGIGITLAGFCVYQLFGPPKKPVLRFGLRKEAKVRSRE